MALCPSFNFVNRQILPKKMIDIGTSAYIGIIDWRELPKRNKTG